MSSTIMTTTLGRAISRRGLRCVGERESQRTRRFEEIDFSFFAMFVVLAKCIIVSGRYDRFF